MTSIETAAVSIVDEMAGKLLDATIEIVRVKLVKRGIAITYFATQDILLKLVNEDKIEVIFQAGDTHRNRYVPKDRTRLFDVVA